MTITEQKAFLRAYQGASPWTPPAAGIGKPFWRTAAPR